MSWELVQKLVSEPVSPTNMTFSISGNRTTAGDVTLNATVLFERPFGDATIWLSGVIIFSFLIVGIALNFITVLVIAKYHCLRNVFAYFMFSLCISDIISALISPLFWYRRTLGFDLFQIPYFFCKFYWAVDITTSFATAMHIVAFGFLRYVSIRWPFKKISKNVAIVSILSIWILSLGFGFVPYAIFFEAQVRDRHSDLADARWPSCTVNLEWYQHYLLYQKIFYSLFLYVPLLLVVLISVLTSIEVRRSTRKSSMNKAYLLRREKRDKQAVMQLMLIVASFLLGYIPFTAYEFWSTLDRENTPHVMRVDYYFGLSEYFFIRFSECLNPIFYNFGSKRMRKSTWEYLKHGFRKPSRARRYSMASGRTSIPSISARMF